MKIIKFSRLVLLLTIVMVLSIIIPKYYWMAFEKRVRPTNFIYSSLKNNFISMNVKNKKMHLYDDKHREVSRREFESLAPLYYYRNLIYHGTMPDSINGFPVNMDEIKKNTIFFNIKSKDILTSQIQLFPLLESKPDGPKLNMPKDFFRIKDRMEFINCEKNKVEEAPTKLFTKALKDNGFVFPAEGIWGNPSTMKPYDDGYFVLDSGNNLFHIKKVKGKPVIHVKKLPSGIKPIYILITEMRLKEFHAVIITEKSEVYLVSFDNYKLIKLPIPEYDYRNTQLRFSGTILTRTILLSKDTLNSVVVTDRNYKPIASISEASVDKWATDAGTILKTVAPFSLALKNSNTTFVDFYFKLTGLLSLVGILLSLIVYFIIDTKFREERKSTKTDYLIILFTGVYGLIALLLVPDESWKI